MGTARRTALLGALLAALGASACSDGGRREVDFQNLEAVSSLAYGEAAEAADQRRFTVCVAPILPAREGYRAYLALIRHLEQKSGIPMRVVYPGSYRAAQQWVEAGEADLAFTCTGMFAGGRNRSAFVLLATPVAGGRVTTRSLILVPEGSPARSAEDLREGDFAFVDDLSLTGYQYPISRLGRGERLPVKAVFTGSHESSIRLVALGRVAGAGVDAAAFAQFSAAHPSEAAKVRVLEESPEFGMPPVVVSDRVPVEKRALLLSLLTGLASDRAGGELLRDLRLDRYVPADRKLYEPALELAREAHGR